jgi:leucyl-tRNA synthetase
MICVNELTTLGCNKREVLEPLAILISPYAPHIAEELWSLLGHTSSIVRAAFPEFREEYLVESNFEYPVMINGKLRAKLDLPLTMTVPEIEKEALEKRFISALSRVADVIENSTEPLVNNPLNLTLVEIFKTANDARIRIQRAQNPLQAQNQEQSRIGLKLSKFFVQAIPKVDQDSIDLIGFFRNLTGSNIIKAYNLFRNLFNGAIVEIYTNSGRQKPSNQLRAEKQAIPTIIQGLKIFINFYKNTELFEPLQEVLEVFEEAVKLKESFDKIPSANVITNTPPARQRRLA